MDCSWKSSKPTPRLVTFARWIRASVMAFVVFLATTQITLPLPQARLRHASRLNDGNVGAAAVLLLLVIFALARTADATTFVVGDDRDLLDAADNVVVGEVESVQNTATGNRIDRLAQVRVQENLKGTLPSRITVRLAGGEIDGRRHVVFGAADLSPAERVLLFLRRRDDGTFTTAQMALGKFSLVGDAGSAVAVRELHDATVLRAGAGGLVRRKPWDIRRLADLEASLRAPGASPGAAPEALLPPGYRGTFTFLSSPPARWYEADDGLDIPFRIEGGAANGDVDPTWAVAQAMSAWSRVDCSTVHPVAAGDATPVSSTDCDGLSQILLDDPLDELDPPVRCKGVVGVGGFCSVPGDRVVDGVVYDRITEGDVVINRGFESCPSWNDVNFSEILTHEVGHTLGLGHSSKDPQESDPRLADAVMFFRAHMDGRGAVVMEDDRDGICTLYPHHALHDADGDGIPDGVDDCPSIADSAQMDHDGDGLGDLCDPLTMGPGMLRPALTGGGGSRIKIAALLRPEAPLDPAHETLTISILAGRSVIHRLVLAPDTWGPTNGTAFTAQRRDGAQRESIQMQLQRDGSWKFRLRGRGVDMGRSLTSMATVRIEIGAYVGAGILRDGLAATGGRGE